MDLEVRKLRVTRNKSTWPALKISNDLPILEVCMYTCTWAHTHTHVARDVLYTSQHVNFILKVIKVTEGFQGTWHVNESKSIASDFGEWMDKRGKEERGSVQPPHVWLGQPGSAIRWTGTQWGTALKEGIVASVLKVWNLWAHEPIYESYLVSR